MNDALRLTYVSLQLIGWCSGTGVLVQIRLSQGLLYLGKGLLQLGALHSDRQVVCRVALGAMAIVSYSGLFMRNTLLRSVCNFCL